MNQKHLWLNGERQYQWIQQFDKSREAGTSAEAEAAEMICSGFEALGLSAIMEPFSFEENEILEESLEVLLPYQKHYPLRICRNSSDTGEKGCCAPLLYAEEGNEIVMEQAAGRIVLLNGPVDAGMLERLKQSGAAGYLSICGTPLDQGEDRIPPRRTQKSLESVMPGAVIHYLDALDMLENGAELVCLTGLQKKIQKYSQNVRVRIDGSCFPEEVVTITAHYDSVPEGPGAYDNMAGVSVLYGLAGHFQEHRPKRSLELISFGAEEKGLRGSRAYVSEHGPELKSQRFNLNIDLAGQLIGTNSLGVTADASAFLLCSHLLKKAGICTNIAHDICGSDSNAFAWNGVPALTVNRNGFGMHTKHDTLAWISPRGLQKTNELVFELADHLLNSDSLDFCRDIPQDFMKKLDEYFGKN